MLCWSVIVGLTIFLPSLFKHISFCNARRRCSSIGTLQTDAKYGNCKIEQHYIPNYRDINSTLFDFSKYENVIILGASNPLSKNYLTLFNLLGNKSALLDNPNLFSTIAYGAEVTLGAVPLAISDFCNSKGTLDFTFIIAYLNDEACSMNAGINNIVELIHAGGDAHFGTSCSSVTAHTGLMFKHNNIPVFSASSSQSSLDNKEIYGTLIRGGNSVYQLVLAFEEVFQYYGWQDITVLTDEGVVCVGGGLGLRNLYQQTRLRKIAYDTISGKASDEQLLRRLNNFKKRSRVLVFCLSGPNTRRLMNLAHREGMTTSDYVYLTYTLMVTPGHYEPWGVTTGLDQAVINKLKEPFARVKQLVVAEYEDQSRKSYDELLSRISLQNQDLPFWTNSTIDELVISSSLVGVYMYRSVWLFLDIIRSIIQDGRDIRDGNLYFQRARNRTIMGDFGTVRFNENTDAINNYWLLQLKPDEKQYTQLLQVGMSQPAGQRIMLRDDAYWGTADEKAPPNEPRCGFQGTKCLTPSQINVIAYFCVVGTIILLTAICSVVKRKRKLKRAIYKMAWNIPVNEVQFNPRSIGYNAPMIAKSHFSGHSDNTTRSGSRRWPIRTISSTVAEAEQQIFTNICLYKGNLLAVKKVEKSTCKFLKEELMDLANLKEIHHENINPFIGVCVNEPFVHILTQYCSKGSLQDLLEREEIQLDWLFKCSLIYDLANGLEFIHNSFIISHGYLRSSCCVVDNRWVLKITNVGLNHITRTNIIDAEIEEYQFFKDKLWTAPELLRLASDSPLSGTQKGDVYSFGIILQEILYRAMPFYLNNATPKEIVWKVKDEQNPPYRPFFLKLQDQDADSKILELMQECWKEDPHQRPDMKRVNKQLLKLNKGRKINILDNIVQKLERYANNLEEVVVKRAEEVASEKAKTDRLLYRLLPRPVAEKLKNGESVAPEVYDRVTIYFSDIVGFTEISSESNPVQVVDLLNDLYTLFDDIIDQYDVYKVETIGDAYMVVSGCPNRNQNKHIFEIADMSLSLRNNVQKFKIRHLPGRPLWIRIGLHTGPCATGVVGSTMPRYCLFGHTINTAKEMEGSGESMEIHVSQDCYKLLVKREKYKLTPRGQINIKGIGVTVTYWLDESDP